LHETANETFPTKMQVKDLNFYYGEFRALTGITIDLKERQITALIGPSGCGKSTFLRTLNRMNETIPGTRIEGQVASRGRCYWMARTSTRHR